MTFTREERWLPAATPWLQTAMKRILSVETL